MAIPDVILADPETGMLYLDSIPNLDEKIADAVASTDAPARAAAAAVEAALVDADVPLRTDPGMPLGGAGLGYIDQDVDSANHTVRAIREDGVNELPLLETIQQRFGLGGATQEAAPSGETRVALTVDSQRRMLESTLGADGLVPADVLRAQHERVCLLSPSFTFRGDSITAGAFGNGVSVASHASTILDGPVSKRGYPGEGALAIVRRQGAAPLLATVPGGSIPASGAVAVTLNSPFNSGADAQQGTPDGTAMTGWLAGVKGELGGTAAAQTFTRARAGAVIPVAGPVKWVDEFETAHRDDVQILGIGRNGYGDTNGILDAVKKSVAYNRGPTLVLGVLTRTDETKGSSAHTSITSLNDALWQVYGNRFFDHRRYLIDFGLAAAGITPTADDLAAIAADTIPPSLTGDGLHLNAAGYTVTALAIIAHLKSIGWIK